MYYLTIKESGPDLDIVTTRAMILLAAIAAIVYRTDQYYFLNIGAGLILLVAAIFMNLLLVRFRVHKLLLVAISACLLFIATRSISFALIFLLYGYLSKFLNRAATITVSEEGIRVKKLLSSSRYRWEEFSNIILKDNLLTMDFKNNKLIQVTIDEIQARIDEIGFNSYCKRFI